MPSFCHSIVKRYCRMVLLKRESYCPWHYSLVISRYAQTIVTGPWSPHSHPIFKLEMLSKQARLIDDNDPSRIRAVRWPRQHKTSGYPALQPTASQRARMNEFSWTLAVYLGILPLSLRLELYDISQSLHLRRILNTANGHRRVNMEWKKLTIPLRYGSHSPHNVTI